MKFLSLLLALAGLTGAVRAAELLPIEQQVAEAIKAPGVTVVHFWATWCPNCKAELANGGWRDFVDTNADVNFIFINAWDPKPGTPVLETYGLAKQENFKSLQHPNESRKEDKMSSFLGLPVSWLPTTWVFRDGKLRYALNYGEVRFPMLQQLVRDSTDKWKHAKPAATPAPTAATPAPAATP